MRESLGFRVWGLGFGRAPSLFVEALVPFQTFESLSTFLDCPTRTRESESPGLLNLKFLLASLQHALALGLG